MDISKYEITTPFGWVTGYPLNQSDPANHPGQGFHNGIDYGVPMDTPVVVNGVQIGLSNNTGASTGPHLHVGKYSGGAAQNPGVGNGFKFARAVVFDTGQDATNGTYVRITGDGALWNYLHLAKGSVQVKAGQVLDGPAEGDDMVKPSEADVYSAFRQFAGKEPANPDQVRYYMDRDIRELYHDLMFYEVLAGQQKVEQAFKDLRPWSPINTPPYTDQTAYYSSRPAEVLYRDLATELKKKLDEAPQAPATAGGYTDADRATATETNTLVKQIWSKISSVFK